jgi:hypothetical protein
MLNETMVEEEPEVEIEDLANARHLDRAAGRGPRNYGLVGAYARIWFWSLFAFGLPSGCSCSSASFDVESGVGREA